METATVILMCNAALNKNILRCHLYVNKLVIFDGCQLAVDSRLAEQRQRPGAERPLYYNPLY